MHMLEKLPGKPQGAPQGAHFGAPQGAPPGAPQGVPPGALQGAPQGAPQGVPGASESQGVSWTMQKSQDMMLYHPFTMMISGPTCKLMLSQLN